MPGDMIEEDLDTAIKVVIVGNGAVGKSSMIQRYCRGLYTRDYKKTIGVDFLERHIEVNEQEVRLMLWDTAGQEEFDAITRSYYRGAQACVVAFSVVDRASFEAVESWIRKVEDEVGQIVTVLVQNKTDLLYDAAMTPEEVEDLAERLDLKLIRTSVKQNHNVDEDIFTTNEAVDERQTVTRTTVGTERSSSTLQLHPARRRTHGKRKLHLHKCSLV